jgi:NifU-like protein
MWDYTNKVMDHFLNPRNVGEVQEPDAVAEVGNITCGDALKITIKLDSEGKICECKFKTFGCASAIASSSVLTELVIGMTLEEAANVTNKDIVKHLGTLPEEKMHCSVMGMEALQAAIADYKKRHGEAVEEVEADDDHDGRIVCRCFGITDVKIRKVAKENDLHTAEQITQYTKAGGACGTCLDQIQTILDSLWKEKAEPAEEKEDSADEFESLSMVQKVIKVQSVIDREIRPVLERDGGDCELVDISENTAYIRMKGHCQMCPASQVTLKNLVQAKLNDLVSPIIVVEDAGK